MGKREDNRRQKRTALATAARQQVLASGYDAATIDDIAAAAGVSRATFFRYFKSKEDAFFAAANDHLTAFEDTLHAPLPGETPLRTIRRAFLDIATYYESTRDERLAQYQVIQATRGLGDYDATLDVKWEAAIATALSEQLPGVEARIAAGAIIGIMRVVLRDWFANGARGDLRAVGVRAFTVVDQGLSALIASHS